MVTPTLPANLERPQRSDSKWRTGRTVGRTVYVQVGDEPSDDDLLVGLMDTPDLAAHVVNCVNAMQQPGGL